MKAYRTYKGVKIYRNKELVTGSDYDFTVNGTIKKRKTEYTYNYTFGEFSKSYPHTTIDECIESIEWIRKHSELDDVEFAEVLNK